MIGFLLLGGLLGPVLLPSARALGEQPYDSNVVIGTSHFDVNAGQSVAQSFVASAQYAIVSVTLLLRNTGDTTDAIKVTVRRDLGGVPSNAVLAAGEIVVGDTLVGQRSVPFTLAPVLTEGTLYWIVAESASSAANTYEWHDSSSNTYASGKAMTTGLLGWSDPLLPTDMYFVTYGRDPDANLSAEIVPTTADIQPGDVVMFSVAMSNTGNAAAGTAWLNDTLLPGFEYISDTAADAGSSTPHPSYTFADVGNGAQSFDLVARVDPMIDPGTVLSKVLTLQYTDSTGALRIAPDASATVVIGIVTKSVYLHPDSVGATRRLTAAKPTGGAGSVYIYNLRRDNSEHNFDLEPVLARPFHVVAASVTLYIDTPQHDERNLDVNLTLADWNGVTLVRLASVERRIRTNNLNDFQAFAFGFPPVDHTFGVGSRIRLTIVNRGTSDRDLALAMNSTFAASGLALRTTSYVRIDTFELRDAAGMPSAWSPKEALVVRANVSDPFGTSEIAGAWVTIVAPSGSLVVNDQPIPILATDPSALSAWRVFELAQGAPLMNGTYFVRVRAEESDGAQDLAEGTALVRAPRFRLAKTTNVTNVLGGQRFAYDVWFNNTGTGPAEQVWLNDSLPSGVQFVSSSDPSAKTGDFNWTWSSLAPGAYSLRIEVDAIGGTAFFRNYAFLNYTDEKGFEWPMEMAHVEVSFNGPAVSLSMSSNPTIHSNETVVFMFTLRNTGNSSSTMWLNDSLPAGLTYVSDTADALGGIRTVSGSQVNFRFDSMASGATWRFNLTARVGPAMPRGTELVNRATINFLNANGSAMPPGNATFQMTVVAPLVPSAGLSIAQQVATPSDIIDIILEFSNAGNEPAHDVWINLTLGPYIAFVNASVPRDPPNSSARFVLSDVPVGPRTVFLNVTIRSNVTDRSLLTVGGTLTYADGFRNPPSTVVIAPDSVEASVPDFQLTVTPDVAVIEANTTASFIITQANAGSGVAGDVMLSLSLPAGFVHVADTADVAAIRTGSTSTWSWLNVAPGPKQFTVLLRARPSVPDGTAANLTFQLFYTDTNGNPRLNPPHIVRVTIVAPKLEMTLSPTPRLVRPGDTIGLTVTIRNEGSTAMRQLWVKAVIDPFFIVVTPESEAWTFADFSPGQETRVNIILRVRPEAPANAVLLAIFEANYTNSEGGDAGSPRQYAAAVQIEDLAILYYGSSGGILAAVAILLVWIRQRRAEIEEVFLVNRDGVLLYHIARSLTNDKDEDVVSGMLTAVQDFVKDAFQYGERQGLSHLDFGDYRILIERSDHVYIAVVYSGLGARFLRRKVRKVLETIEIAYAKVLDHWDGDMEKVVGAKDIIRAYLLKSSGGMAREGRPKPM